MSKPETIKIDILNDRIQKLEAENEKLRAIAKKLSCDACKYQYEDGLIEPCKSCNKDSNWELGIDSVIK